MTTSKGESERSVDEPIAIVPYDAAWPELFAQERDRILDSIGQNGVVAIEHFGSTAVPGLCAKPIVDLLVGVAPWPPDTALRMQLRNLGYEDLGEAGVPGRIYFRRRGSRAYNLALVAHGGPLFIYNFIVRELLRSQPELRAEYEAAKRTAFNAGATSLLAYSEHKSTFVRRLVEHARASLTATIAEIRTERLLLRPLQPRDLGAFAAMNADARVMEHFPAVLSRTESDALLDRIRNHWAEQGFGVWAIELPSQAAFIGFAGLSRPTFDAHFTPCVEVGWRLAAEHWGRGYATEAARAAVRIGFSKLGLGEIVSFTVPANRRSLRVMEKLGMRRNPEDDFEHPKLAEGHPLRRHVLCRLRREPRDDG